MAEQILWQPQPKQHLLLSCPVEDCLYGGSRGGGKTDALLGDWMQHAADYGAHARGLLLRRTYPELEEVEQRCQALFPGLGASYRASRHAWTWPSGALLRLRYFAREQDASRYQGWSNTWIGVDELTNFASLRGLDLLRATLRSAHGVPCLWRATANPGGVLHNQVKARYIDPAPPMTPFYDARGSTWRVFIPATLDDNPALLRNDPQYWRRVEAAAAGRADLLKAWRYGLWDIVSGGMFDDLWDPSVHVVAPFPVPQGWRIDRTHDWGSSKPFCTLWYAEANGDAVRLPGGATRRWPRGHLLVIAEDYGWNGEPNTGLRLTATQIAERVKRAEAAMGYRVLPGPADDPIFEVRNGACMADDMAKVGITWDKPSKGPGSRVTGWNKIRELLTNARATPQEHAGLSVFATCRHVIRTLPVLPRDDLDGDDVNSDAEDHAPDALRLRVLMPKRQATRVDVVV